MIESLKENQVFVFGSNGDGFHGAGAAGFAFRYKKGNWRQDEFFLKAMKSKNKEDKIGKYAVFGVSRGFQEGKQGKSYAIETIKKIGYKRSVPLKEIQSQIDDFLVFAKNHPHLEFLVTKIGCSLAGYTVSEIRNLFKRKIPKNVILPKEFLFYYAGIGSRETPSEILNIMSKLGILLEKKGYILRSGGAIGADSAFEKHCTRKEIFTAKDATMKAINLAENYHPNFKNLNDYVQALMGRNMQIILGRDLDTPVDFVICYFNPKKIGGTGQAIRYCSKHNIKIFNLFNKEDIVAFKKFYKKL